VEAQLDQLGDAEMPVDVWVDADGLPRRLQIDLGGMVAAMGLDGGSAVMTIEFFDYGVPVDIEVPSPDEVTPITEVLGGLGGAFGAGS
jgi:hypothetical protein